MRGNDGATAGEHSKAAVRQFGRLKQKPARAKPSPIDDVGDVLPDAVTYLWEWYLDLVRGVAGNGMTSPQPSWGDVGWWSQLTKQPLEIWEAKALISLGVRRAEIEGEHQRQQAQINAGRNKA